MDGILICGLINIETAIKTEIFPVPYSPIEYQFHGINTSVSGTGYNIVKALKTLGDNPVFLSLIGNDMYKEIILSEAEINGIETQYILPVLEQTAQSGILYNGTDRKIILDLKNIQDTLYPEHLIDEIAGRIDTAVICNINFSRNLLRILKNSGKTIATDIHAIIDVGDNYNNDYIRYSDILFLSNVNIIGNEENVIRQLSQKYNHKIITVTMGKDGLLMYVRSDNKIKYFPSVKTGETVNTTGAGDALLSCFIHFYRKTDDPYYAIKLATVFASYKIGFTGGANGFLTEDALIKLNTKIQSGG